MTETVTVKSFGNPNPWEHGITYWDVVFDRNGADFSCTWGKKDTEPSVGETVEGEFFEKNGDWRFRKASKPQGGGGSTSSGGGSQNHSGKSKEWKPEQERDPERSARILRQHSQEMALRYCTLLGDRVPLDQIFNYANQFDNDVIQAGQKSLQASGNATPGESERTAALPASGSPASEQAPADDTHQHFCKLLEDAGLNAQAAFTLATYIVGKFNNDQCRRAQVRLGNLETQQDTLSKLRIAYEKATGDLLPDPADDEDIPF